MGWDYEVLDEQILIDKSYDVIRKDFNEDLKKLGARKAVENVVDNFDVLGQVKESVGTSDFLEQCDNAFKILTSSMSVISKASGIGETYYCHLKFHGSDVRTEWDCAEKIISDCNKLIEYYKDMEMKNVQEKENELSELSNEDKMQKEFILGWIHDYKKRVEKYKILLNIRDGKSVMEIFIRELESLNALYCEQTGKNMESMRKNICITAYDALEIRRQQSSRLLSDIGKSIFRDIFQSVKYDRVNSPYTYFLDSIQ